jgi:hypothetical protein
VGGIYQAENQLVDGKRAERFSLPTDDPSNIYANEYKKALVLVLTLDNTEEGARNVRITVRAEATPLITEDGNGGYLWDANYLSNAVTFTPATADATAVSLTQAPPNPIPPLETDEGEVARLVLPPDGILHRRRDGRG